MLSQCINTDLREMNEFMVIYTLLTKFVPSTKSQQIIWQKSLAVRFLVLSLHRRFKVLFATTLDFARILQYFHVRH